MCPFLITKQRLFHTLFAGALFVLLVSTAYFTYALHNPATANVTYFFITRLDTGAFWSTKADITYHDSGLVVTERTLSFTSSVALNFYISGSCVNCQPITCAPYFGAHAQVYAGPGTYTVSPGTSKHFDVKCSATNGTIGIGHLIINVTAPYSTPYGTPYGYPYPYPTPYAYPYPYPTPYGTPYGYPYPYPTPYAYPYPYPTPYGCLLYTSPSPRD